MNEEWARLHYEWQKLLRWHGIGSLHVVEAMSFRGEFARKSEFWGVRRQQELDDLLLAFARLIRDCGASPVGVSMDARHLNTEKQRLAKKNLLFSGALDALFSAAGDGAFLTFTCDDEQDSAMEYYRLLNKYKQQHPDIRYRVAGICFMDDRLVPSLQAADMVAYVMREETQRAAETPHREPNRLVAVLSTNSETTLRFDPEGFYRL